MYTARMFGAKALLKTVATAATQKKKKKYSMQGRLELKSLLAALISQFIKENTLPGISKTYFNLWPRCPVNREQTLMQFHAAVIREQRCVMTASDSPSTDP